VGNFAEQTQFVQGQDGATPYVESNYGNSTVNGGEKNKPKQSEF
jgi:hypothetical protein